MENIVSAPKTDMFRFRINPEIRSQVEDPAAEALLAGQFHTGDTLVLTVRENSLAIAPPVR